MPSPVDILTNLYYQPLPLCSHSILKMAIQDSELLFCQLWPLEDHRCNKNLYKDQFTDKKQMG